MNIAMGRVARPPELDTLFAVAERKAEKSRGPKQQLFCYNGFSRNPDVEIDPLPRFGDVRLLALMPVLCLPASSAGVNCHTKCDWQWISPNYVRLSLPRTPM